jgi:hypothetical protein
LCLLRIESNNGKQTSSINLTWSLVQTEGHRDQSKKEIPGRAKGPTIQGESDGELT